jgi:hypothetical protein
MTATRKRHSTKRGQAATQASARPKASGVLYLAFELGWNEWKLAFATGPVVSPRLRTIGGRNLHALMQEIAKAKERFGLACRLRRNSALPNRRNRCSNSRSVPL